ncbi:alkaline phosphatase family protein-like protein [Xylogone sp. PMI_703]|nr:alkaline phosphatase family protein-like protein [Xylogone sp. PMI_703]
MANFPAIAAAVSSIALRALCYTFLRWIPSSIFIKPIFTLFFIYIPSFISLSRTQPQYDVLEDRINVTLTDTEVESSDPSSGPPSTDLRNHDNGSEETIQEDIAITETIVLEERSPKVLRTLLTGLPSPTSNLLSLLTLLVNIALVLGVTDYLYTARVLYPSQDVSFVRVGYVTPTEAKLLIREPRESQLPLFLSYRTVNGWGDNSAWKSGGEVYYLTNDTDYTGVISVPLPNIPETTYQWVTSNNHTGYFTTPPKPGNVGRHGTYSFLTTSCIIPRFPYNPSDHALAMPGFRHLAKVLELIPGGAQFMLFLGDFIYIDVPNRYNAKLEDYRREYRHVFASPDWPAVGRNLSWIATIDDHEIANDWDNGTVGVYSNAVSAWNDYHGSVNPPFARQAGSNYKPRSGATYYEFTQGPASFFLLDTRKYRSPSSVLPANNTEKTMLGADQLEDLLAYLARPEPRGVRWKFVVSSVPFTKNWRVNSLDTWAGYLAERQKILEAMWDVGARGGVGVVVLSGDRHEFAATAFPPPPDGKWPLSATVHEFSTSPLSQFYLPLQTYKQTDDEDVMIRYIPEGNSKFGAITIENPEAGDQSILKFRLYVDGAEAWTSIILSPPAVSGSARLKDALWGQGIW